MPAQRVSINVAGTELDGILHLGDKDALGGAAFRTPAAGANARGTPTTASGSATKTNANT